MWRNRRPFHAGRLHKLLHEKAGWKMPNSNEKTQAAVGNAAAMAVEPAGAGSGGGNTPQRHPLSTVIRSKGIFWIAEEDRAVIEWASAGPIFSPHLQGMSPCHWARNYLPPHERDSAFTSIQVADMKKLPPSGKKPQRSHSKGSVEDIDWGWVPRYEDRKTEIVLIGIGMDDAAISQALEEALLTADEEAALQNQSPNKDFCESLRGLNHPFYQLTQILVEKLDEAQRDPKMRAVFNRNEKNSLSHSGVVFQGHTPEVQGHTH